MLDLQQFCGTEETRPYLMKPFSRNGHTYATDGCIMLRVAQRDGVSDVEVKFNPDAPLAGIEAAQFCRPSFEFPQAPIEKGECTACDGSGYEHQCPDCECVCGVCAGEGNVDIERRISTTIGQKIFKLYYVRQMLSLPGIEIEIPESDNQKPMFFRFDEGVGALMPMRSQYDNHIDLKLDRAA